MMDHRSSHEGGQQAYQNYWQEWQKFWQRARELFFYRLREKILEGQPLEKLDNLQALEIPCAILKNWQICELWLECCGAEYDKMLRTPEYQKIYAQCINAYLLQKHALDKQQFLEGM